MGWRGTLRSLEAAANRADRNAKRRQKELERSRAAQQKLAELEEAAYEVEVFENYIERLQTIHTECSNSIDWESVLTQSEPPEPIRSNKKEKEAKLKSHNFKPNIFHKLFRQSEKIREKLRKKIVDARNSDEATYQAALREYTDDLRSWKNEREIALNIQAGDPEALVCALKKYGEFAEIGEIGTQLQFSIDHKNNLRVDLNSHSKDIIPAESKSLLKNGRLSVKKMNKGSFNELFQDYVCSSLLRVAREVFAILPVDKVEVTALDEMLNSATGHMEEQPIVSALFTRNTIEKMNLDKIDPSDSMSNFVCNMDFKKSNGFRPVTRLNWNR